MQEFTDKAYNQMVESMSKPRVSHDMGGMVDPLDEPVGKGSTKADWEAWKTQNQPTVIECSLELKEKFLSEWQNTQMLPCPESIPFAFNLVPESRMAELFKVKPLAAKKLDPRAKLPTRAYASNGYDLTALEGCEVKYGEVTQIRTGLAFDLSGYLMHILPKSGLAVKYGIHTMAGVIDSSYVGEVIVCLTKLTPGTHVFRDGDKIAQFILIRTENPEIQEVQELPSTERGSNGFGSSGT